MGFRFRKQVGLFKGLKLNISKSGPSSFTLGGKGLTLNLGRKGTRTTVGLPGSGASYSTYKPHENPTGNAEKSRTGLWWLLVVLIIGVAVIRALFF